MKPLSLYETALLAQTAYLDARFDVTRWDSYHADTDTRCVVSLHKQRGLVTVAFRGTFSMRNWLLNLRIKPAEGVHAGVSAAVDYHEQTILEYLLSVPWSYLLITGHSLGGGLANEFARRIYDAGYRGIKVVTFGAVRSHTKAVARECRTGHGRDTWRVVNNNDVVARLLGITYRHIGQVIYFDRRGHAHTRMPWGTKLWDGLAGRVRSPLADGISDHGMDDYIRLCAGVEIADFYKEKF